MRKASTPKDCFILVIEPHTQVCEALRFTLDFWGFRVLTANSIKSAKMQMLLHSFTPDVVLVDLPIPQREHDFSIIENVTMLLAQFGLNVPVIAMTGNVDQTFRTIVEEKGWSYLLKPFHPGALFSLLVSFSKINMH